MARMAALFLFMKLPDELFDLGDAALENQIAVVGLALGVSQGLTVKSQNLQK